MGMESNNLIQRIERLEARNKRVEGDKAWETSWARRLSIAVLTYVVVVVYLQFVVHITPWINALVPVIGFMLSTVALSSLKRRWVQRRSKRLK
jgi:Flp pilus assembly protein TadB